MPKGTDQTNTYTSAKMGCGLSKPFRKHKAGTKPPSSSQQEVPAALSAASEKQPTEQVITPNKQDEKPKPKLDSKPTTTPSKPFTPSASRPSNTTTTSDLNYQTATYLAATAVYNDPSDTCNPSNSNPHHGGHHHGGTAYPPDHSIPAPDTTVPSPTTTHSYSGGHSSYHYSSGTYGGDYGGYSTHSYSGGDSGGGFSGGGDSGCSGGFSC